MVQSVAGLMLDLDDESVPLVRRLMSALRTEIRSGRYAAAQLCAFADERHRLRESFRCDAFT